MNYYDKVMTESAELLEFANLKPIVNYDYSMSDEEILESYGIFSLLEGMGEDNNGKQDNISQNDIVQTKATLAKMKKKKDGKGIVALCRKLAAKAKKHKWAIALFVTAAGAAVAVISTNGFEAQREELQKIIEDLQRSLNDQMDDFKSSEQARELSKIGDKLVNVSDNVKDTVSKGVDKVGDQAENISNKAGDVAKKVGATMVNAGKTITKISDKITKLGQEAIKLDTAIKQNRAARKSL